MLNTPIPPIQCWDITKRLRRCGRKHLSLVQQHYAGAGGGGGGGEQKEVKNSSLLNSFPVVVVFSSFSPCLCLLVSLSFSLFFCTYSRTSQIAAAQAGITLVSTQPETMECSGAYKGLNAHFPLALKSTDSVLPFWTIIYSVLFRKAASTPF